MVAVMVKIGFIHAIDEYSAANVSSGFQVLEVESLILVIKVC